jgi:ATP-dependent DNA helicase RecG
VPPEKPAFLDRAWRRLREEVQAGHQAYVVCPRIGDGAAGDDDVEPPSDGDSARRPPLAVTEVAPLLAEGPLRGLRIGVLHGRLPADEKDAVMRGFAAGDLDVLVATTVIEVGVDVPNASLMVIEHAERFGLSQLHQLRGRVGRGSAASVCLLLYQSPLGPVAKQRLMTMRETTDGFEIARRDLEIRGPGEFLGARQSGQAMLRFANLETDQWIVDQARDVAAWLLESERPELEAIVDAHLQRWLGGREEFLKV